MSQGHIASKAEGHSLELFRSFEDFSTYVSKFPLNSWDVSLPMEGLLQAEVTGGEWFIDDPDGSICRGPNQVVELYNGRRTVEHPRGSATREGITVQTEYKYLNLVYQNREYDRKPLDRGIVWIMVPRPRVGLRNPIMHFCVEKTKLQHQPEELTEKLVSATTEATRFVLGALIEDL